MSVSIQDLYARYEGLELAAEGGMSAIYRGRQRSTGRLCALKQFTYPAWVDFEEHAGQVMLRFLLRLRLHHPNILPVIDGGFARDGAVLAFPWVRGPLDDAAVSDWPSLRRGLLQLLSALSRLHALGGVHRDVKPDNVLIDHDGSWQLADFGILRAMSELAEVSRPQGTPFYVSPEQIQDQKSLYRPWTDLYAVGGLAWRLATGAPPFMGSPAAVVRSHLRELPGRFEPRFPVPDGFEAWVRRLLSKHPWERWVYAADAARALRALEEDEPTERPSWPSRPPPLALRPIDPEAPEWLRILQPVRSPRTLAWIWEQLSAVDASGRPRVVQVADTWDIQHTIGRAVTRLAESGLGLSFFPLTVSIEGYLRLIFTDDPELQLELARSFGAALDHDGLRRALDGDRALQAELICSAARGRPVLALTRSRSLAEAVASRQDGKVLLFHLDGSAPPGPLLLSLEERVEILAERVERPRDELEALARLGLRRALMELLPAELALVKQVSTPPAEPPDTD